MIEVRVARTAEVQAVTDGGWPEGYLWMRDTPFRRQELQVLVNFGNARYGSGSHWIEARFKPAVQQHTSTPCPDSVPNTLNLRKRC